MKKSHSLNISDSPPLDILHMNLLRDLWSDAICCQSLDYSIDLLFAHWFVDAHCRVEAALIGWWRIMSLSYGQSGLRSNQKSLHFNNKSYLEKYVLIFNKNAKKILSDKKWLRDVKWRKVRDVQIVRNLDIYRPGRFRQKCPVLRKQETLKKDNN